MTVNELIEKLKEYGDEKERDLAQVRITNFAGAVLADDLQEFDVKFGTNCVDIPIDAQVSLIYPDDDEDDIDWDDWEDDDDDEDEDEDEESSFKP